MLPLLIGIASVTLAPPVEVWESVVNRAAKLAGRDLVTDLRSVVDPLIERETSRVVSSNETRCREVFKYMRRLNDPLRAYAVAVSMRIIARAFKNQISFSDLRAFCREVVYTIGKRALTIGRGLGLAIAALADFDIETLSLLPSTGIRLFVERVNKNVREEYLGAVDLALELASLSIVMLKAYTSKPRLVREIYQRCESSVVELVEELEAYLDTIAILLDEDNREALKALPGVKHG